MPFESLMKLCSTTPSLPHTQPGPDHGGQVPRGCGPRRDGGNPRPRVWGNAAPEPEAASSRAN